jgi:preprotein translocase subunit SecF
MIRFSKYLWVYAVISSMVLVPGIISLMLFGMKPSVDFTGGTLLELQFQNSVQQQSVEQLLSDNHITSTSVQKSSGNNYIIRLKPDENTQVVNFETSLATSAGQVISVVRNETVGPVLGKELLQKTVAAAVLAIIAILSYVAYAFKNIKFGISAILAMLHDLLVVLGVFSLLGHFYKVEVDTLFVTAFLTTMSFSMHDTIVVFDRIREMIRRGERLPFEAVCDKALTQTIGRSLTNSLTIIFMLIALVLIGGSSVRWFAFALLIGTITGTYSSDFVATPILILWDRWEKRKNKI